MKAKILIADDLQMMIDAYKFHFRDRFDLVTVLSVAEAKQMLRERKFDLLITDLNFEGEEESGLDLIDFATRELPKLPIVVVSGDTETARVIGAMRRRILDFVVKGGEINDGLDLAVERALALRTQNDEQKRGFRYKTKSPLMTDLLSKLERILLSGSQSPILIVGEAGTGKEHLAQHIGTVTKKNVTATNMANHGRDLADSALFGHVRGAFTGANANAVGLIEKAHGGVLFLDEIGETSLDVQAKLLRVVQERRFTPVGATQEKQVDLRFIAATNRDLSEMSESGLFRKDLLERLSTWVLRIPPLRERPEDIVYLTSIFLNEFSRGRPFAQTEDGLFELMSHRWPGNIRELRNTIERIVVLSSTGVLDSAAVKEALAESLQSKTADENPDKKVPARQRTKEDYIRALDSCGGNRTHAARLLGVNPATMFRKISEWGLDQKSKSVPGRPRNAEETA